MPSVIGDNFGCNMDHLVGETATVNDKQTAFGEFRARSILAGNFGAIITSIHVTPRTGLTAPGSAFPAAGLYDMIVFVSGNPLNIVQNNFQRAATDVLTNADRVLYSCPRSTLAPTDVIPPEGLFIPPTRYGHVIVLTPYDAAGVGISTYFNLSVLGRHLTGTDLPVTLR